MSRKRWIGTGILFGWTALCVVLAFLSLDSEAWEDPGAALAQDLLLIIVGVVWLLVVLPTLIVLILDDVERRKSGSQARR